MNRLNGLQCLWLLFFYYYYFFILAFWGLCFYVYPLLSVLLSSHMLQPLKWPLTVKRWHVKLLQVKSNPLWKQAATQRGVICGVWKTARQVLEYKAWSDVKEPTEESSWEGPAGKACIQERVCIRTLINYERSAILSSFKLLTRKKWSAKRVSVFVCACIEFLILLSCFLIHEFGKHLFGHSSIPFNLADAVS